MTFYLLLCVWGYKTGGCIAPTRAPSHRACLFVAEQYRRMNNDDYTKITTRCIGVHQ